MGGYEYEPVAVSHDIAMEDSVRVYPLRHLTSHESPEQLWIRAFAVPRSSNGHVLVGAGVEQVGGRVVTCALTLCTIAAKGNVHQNSCSMRGILV